MKRRTLIVCLLTLLLSAMVFGQTSQPQAQQPQAAPAQALPRDGDDMARAQHFYEMARGMHPIPMDGMPMGMPGGKWWKNAELVQKLQLSDDQLQRLEKIFQDSRLHLIDLHAALEKEEAQLEPLVEAENPDEGQVNSQIDKVAAARAELEKGHTRMLLELRKVLTAEQWKMLHSMPPPMPPFGYSEHIRRRPGMPAPAVAPAPAAAPAPKAPQD